MPIASDGVSATGIQCPPVGFGTDAHSSCHDLRFALCLDNERPSASKWPTYAEVRSQLTTCEPIQSRIWGTFPATKQMRCGATLTVSCNLRLALYIDSDVVLRELYNYHARLRHRCSDAVLDHINGFQCVFCNSKSTWCSIGTALLSLCLRNMSRALRKYKHLE